MKNIIYGTGKAGKDLYHYFKHHHVKIHAFSDTTKKGIFQTLRIIPPEHLPKDCKVYIASDWANEIAQTLVNLGITNFEDATGMTEHFYIDAFFTSLKDINKVSQVLNMLEDNDSKEVYKSIIMYRLTKNPLSIIKSHYPQYLHPECRPMPKDTIFDCGAFTGDTAALFYNKFFKTKPKIICFEPNKNNYQILKKNCPWAESYNIALSDRSGKGYMNDNGISAALTKTGQEVELKSFDSLYYDKLPKNSILKIDVEGSEMDLLRGASNVIRYNKPTIMISIYHKLSDLWEIPLYLKLLNPKYKFYVGHHTGSLTDTVLYCV